MLKKGVTIWLISYMVARLEIVFEISRLTLLRLRPRARIVRLTRADRLDHRSVWFFTRRQGFYLYMQQEPPAPAIRPMVELSDN